MKKYEVPKDKKIALKVVLDDMVFDSFIQRRVF